MQILIHTSIHTGGVICTTPRRHYECWCGDFRPAVLPGRKSVSYASRNQVLKVGLVGRSQRRYPTLFHITNVPQWFHNLRQATRWPGHILNSVRLPTTRTKGRVRLSKRRHTLCYFETICDKLLIRQVVYRILSDLRHFLYFWSFDRPNSGPHTLGHIELKLVRVAALRVVLPRFSPIFHFVSKVWTG